MNIFFDRLKTKHGSYIKAAKFIGVSYKTFYNWHTELRHPSLAQARLIQKQLGVSLDKIYGPPE